jgi:8-amino-7-oxononanoate synthase
MGAMQEWLESNARGRERRGTVRTTTVRARPGVIDLASNDYLGLSTDSRLTSAAITAIEEYGTGSRASRVVTGTHQVHAELEAELCALTGQPAALSFASGYAANLAILTALGGPRVLIALDQHAHASLYDGARLSRSEVQTWPHGDLAALEQLLRERRQPRAMIVVESIYSVLGDASDLAKLAGLAETYDALLVVDEAHGVGVAGAGRGAVHAVGLAGLEHVVMTATLSKALGAQGGAVLGSPLLREHLVSTARTFLFDTALAPAPAAAAAEACRIVRAEPHLAEAVGTVAAQLAEVCGIDQAAGAVQSIPIASAEAAVQISQQLADQGVLVGCFRPPSVPDGVSRLRLTARADLPEDVARHAAAQVASLASAVAAP